MTPKPKRAYNLPQQGNRVFYTTAARAQTQDFLIKNFWVEEPRSPETKLSAPQRSNNSETSKKTWKENKIRTPRMQVRRTYKFCSLNNIFPFNHTATKI